MLKAEFPHDPRQHIKTQLNVPTILRTAAEKTASENKCLQDHETLHPFQFSAFGWKEITMYLPNGHLLNTGPCYLNLRLF